MTRTRPNRWTVVAAISLLNLSAGAGLALADGQATYAKLCASCHAADGRGNAVKAKALKIDPQLLNLGRPAMANTTRDELRTILLKGKNKMPGYEKKLKPAEVDPLLDHALNLAKTIRQGR